VGSGVDTQDKNTMSFCSAKKISDDSTTDRMAERRVKWIQVSSAMISQVASKQRAVEDFLWS